MLKKALQVLQLLTFLNVKRFSKMEKTIRIKYVNLISFRIFRRGLSELSQDNCNEYNSTSYHFFRGKMLMENYPSTKHGEYRLQAKNKRSFCRFHVFLSENLECIRNAAGHNSGIHNREPAFYYSHD